MGRQAREDDAEFESALAATASLLWLLAHELKRDSALYNSIKHGMTVQAGGLGLEIRVDGEQLSELSGGGPAIVYVDRRKSSPSEWTWSEETRWVNPERSMVLADTICKLLDSLWAIARTRYVGAETGMAYLVTPEMLDYVIEAGRNQEGWQTMSRVVGVESKR